MTDMIHYLREYPEWLYLLIPCGVFAYLMIGSLLVVLCTWLSGYKFATLSEDMIGVVVAIVFLWPLVGPVFIGLAFMYGIMESRNKA